MPTLVAIASSRAPASAASKICARLSTRRMLTSTQKRRELGALGFGSVPPDSVHSSVPPPSLEARTNRLNRMAGVRRSAKTFTPKQGQYLAYIHLYTRLHRRPPAETDMQQYFHISPPSVHHMVLTLERAGFIRRQPTVARSIEVLVDPEHLPELL
jgi:hypothetical protein